MSGFRLAQFNIARLAAPIEAPPQNLEFRGAAQAFDFRTRFPTSALMDLVL